MKINFNYLAFLLFLFLACTSKKTAEPHQRYIFYLHGKIIEDQGIQAVSDRYGKYDYIAILETLEKHDFKIQSEARKKDTDIRQYADKIVAEIQQLINSGIPPQNITVIGASKGAVITMLVSTKLANPTINFVLLANCNDWIEENLEVNLYGNILSIFEETDHIGESCDKLIQQSSGVQQFKEIALHTDLGHGFIYRPLEEWILPSVQWANQSIDK